MFHTATETTESDFRNAEDLRLHFLLHLEGARLRLAVLIALLSFPCARLSSENVTVTSYSPAPDGNYASLATTGITSLLGQANSGVSFGPGAPQSGVPLNVFGTTLIEATGSLRVANGATAAGVGNAFLNAVDGLGNAQWNASPAGKFQGTTTAVGTGVAIFNGSNTTAYPVMISAIKGQWAGAGPNSNACELIGYVNGIKLSLQDDYAQTNARNCYITFWVPKSGTYQIQSHPLALPGTFAVYSTQ